MARVSLYLMPANHLPVFRFVRPGGVREAIPALRVRALVNFRPYVRSSGTAAANAAYPECVLDTGSPLTTISQAVWSYLLSGTVTPLPFDPAMPVAQRAVSIGGGRFPYTLGELTVPLFDYDGRTMNLRVVAQLTRDGGALTIPLILGLRGGALDGRVVRAGPDPGAPFGQAWALEDP